MKPAISIKKVRSFMICVLILSVFITGFHLLSILPFRGEATYLTTLDKGLFKAEATNRGETPFAVSKIVRFIAPFHIVDSDLLDMNTLAFTSSNPEAKNLVQTGIYDLSTNLLSYEFDKQNQITESKISISNDGKLILATYESKEGGLSKTYVYDAATNKKLSIFNGVFAAEWLPDNIRFVGMDDYLFIQDIKTGMRENILKISDYAGKLPNLFFDLKLLKDGQTAGIFYNSIGTTHVLKVDINTKNPMKQTLNGQLHYAFPIDNKALAVVGQFNNRYGIYLYDITNNSLELLIDLTNQKLLDISISQDGKKIAYSVMNMDTGWYGIEVHAAYLDHNQVTSNEVVYKDLNHFVDKLLWTKDSQMLYCFQRNTNDTTIFRILFKNVLNSK
ncbi:TolB family protein [Paenibacillus agricola]|uniref:TolB protein n=1 Tax=Paenibacillus agricola TaxID=2716264 RepID=A0ABX0JKT3_9BACL|nr:hypothetical protein [Paenibacillus agricola]NHN35259.1 hypothetical protein [Paenibacillus agricola]